MNNLFKDLSNLKNNQMIGMIFYCYLENETFKLIMTLKTIVEK